MIPWALFPNEQIEDRDPLDIIILWNSSVGSVIGVMKLLDNREEDDYLVAVWLDSPFGKVKNLSKTRYESIFQT